MVADPVLAAFDDLARRRPERPLVLAPARQATVSEVDAKAADLARELAARGLAPGELVGLVAPNGPAFLIGYLALRRARLVPVLCDLALPAAAREGILERFAAAGCLSSSDPWVDLRSDWSFVARPATAAVPSQRLDEGVGAVKLTSGSTGLPRGVVISAAALVADEAQLATTMELGEDDRHMGAIAFSHSYGFSSVVLPALLRGAAVIVPGALGARSDRSATAPLSAAQELGATFFPTVPAWLSAWSRLASPPPLPASVRKVVSAGAPLSAETARAFRERFGIPVHVFYGASECGGITFDRQGDAAERGTVGSPVDGVELELDPETGRLRVRSAAVGERYLQGSGGELGAGSFLTGDLAAWDQLPGGELRLRGRVDDLVIIKGKNVQPREVERVLRELPGIDDVCVLGIGGPEGEKSGAIASATVLRAVVAAAPDSGLTFERIVEQCRGRLADHKIPRSIVFVSELPRDARGKLDRRRLADPALAGSAACLPTPATAAPQRSDR
ncbi:MAG: class I adenylate-forming enzyme family protein [Thermoanaerobaculia bacterium]